MRKNESIKEIKKGVKRRPKEKLGRVIETKRK